MDVLSNIDWSRVPVEFVTQKSPESGCKIRHHEERYCLTVGLLFFKSVYLDKKKISFERLLCLSLKMLSKVTKTCPSPTDHSLKMKKRSNGQKVQGKRRRSSYLVENYWDKRRGIDTPGSTQCFKTFYGGSPGVTLGLIVRSTTGLVLRTLFYVYD